MLDVRGDCFIASCVTQPFVWRGSTWVLRRSFAGSRGSVQYLRGGEAVRGPKPRHAGLREEALWPNCVARVHAGPRRPTRVLEEARERV